ncbi:MAG: T9SS type A sorting domain-containing protein [Bacteroidia bacterium]
MKTLLLLLFVMLQTMPLQAQWAPWQIIQKGRTFCYASGNTKLYLKIDSTETGTNYTRYWNYFRLRGGAGSSLPYQYFFLDSTNWTGEYIEQNNTDHFSFTTRNGKAFTIETQGTTGYSWRCYDLPQNGYITARVDTMMNVTFLNITDSVKFIRFTAADSSDNTVTHWLNNVQLRVSKHYGLLDIIKFITPDTAGIYTLTGFTNPETNWTDLTAKQVFDIQPGDLRIIRNNLELNGPPYLFSTKHTRLKCIERTENTNERIIILKDSFETIHVRYISSLQRYDTLYSNGIKTDSIHLDKYEFLNFLDYEIAAKPLTTSTYILYHTNYLYYFNLPPTIRAKYWLGSFNYDYEKRIWPIYTDFPNSHAYYIEFMGGGYYVTPFMTGGAEYRLPYYFNRGGFSWGNAEDWDKLRNLVSVKEVSSKSVNLYPNPVERYLTLTTTGNWPSELNIIFFTTTGKRVYEKKIHHQESEIDLVSLAAGMYTYIISFPDGRVERGKLCKQ